jgi:hypothetical protein
MFTFPPCIRCRKKCYRAVFVPREHFGTPLKSMCTHARTHAHVRPHMYIRIHKTRKGAQTYEGRLESSWTRLITQSRNFVEVRWRSPFRSASLGKRWMHFLQRSTHFSKTCCRPFITSKFLASELRFHGCKNPEIAWGEIWIEFCVRLGKSGSMEPH